MHWEACTNLPTTKSTTGIHSGSAMSGIVGKIRRRFCLFGDTINMASRAETSCPPGYIQITGVTHSLTIPDLTAAEAAQIEPRGLVQVKGSTEPINMFLIRS